MVEFPEPEQIERSVVAEFKTMKQLVRYILGISIRCRNDDKFLVLKVLQAKDEDVWVEEEGENKVIHWRIVDLADIPAFETITRVRREIQNSDGEYLPTDPQVIYVRKIKEQVVRRYYGHDPAFIKRYEEVAYGLR